MDKCHLINVVNAGTPQQKDDFSFIGGTPRLPEGVDIPECELCGSPQTFFFQIAFPKEHIWNKLSLALFACTSCAHKEYFIPEMLSGKLQGIDIPKGFLDTYQRNFRVLIFNTENATLKQGYIEKVKFKKVVLEERSDMNEVTNKVGGCPVWLLGDETPSTYDSSIGMLFLMQLAEEFEFEIVPDAPGQTTLSLTGAQKISENRFYRLFLANNIYIFGTNDPSNPKVYILTQI